MNLLAALIGIALTIGGGAAAQSAQELQDAARAVEQAASGRPRRDALAAAVQVHDQAAIGLRAEVRNLALREGSLQLVLDAQRDEIGALLASLQRVPQHGAQTLLIHPDGALAAARAGMVLSSAVPPLQIKMQTLSAQVAGLAALRRSRENLERQMAATATQARDLRARLITDHGQRGTAKTSAEAMAIAAALRQGATELTPRLDETTVSPMNLTLPVQGEILNRFGDPHPGLVISTDPGALLTAPLPMTVRFAGTLEGYGGALVLEPGPQQLMILTGLGTLLTHQGEVVTTGSPLAMMPETAQSGDLTSRTDTFAAIRSEHAGTDRREALYIETREARKPVDPLTWFMERKDNP